MSANNGILILKDSRGTFRIKHLVDIGNHMVFISSNSISYEKLNKWFSHDYREAETQKDALRIAGEIFSKLSIVEYGIIELEIPITFNELHSMIPDRPKGISG